MCLFKIFKKNKTQKSKTEQIIESKTEIKSTSSYDNNNNFDLTCDESISYNDTIHYKDNLNYNNSLDYNNPINYNNHNILYGKSTLETINDRSKMLLIDNPITMESSINTNYSDITNDILLNYKFDNSNLDFQADNSSLYDSTIDGADYSNSDYPDSDYSSLDNFDSFNSFSDFGGGDFF